MGFFEKLFGKSNQLEPFPEFKSDYEKLSWFRKTPPWNKMDEKIINIIIKKYNGDPSLVVFVVASMEKDLINQYCKFNNSEYTDSPDLLCSLISQILFNSGCVHLNEMNSLINTSGGKERIIRKYMEVLDSLDSCITIDQNQTAAYFSRATAKLLMRQYHDALKDANDGLSIAKKLKDAMININSMCRNENTQKMIL